MNKKSVIFAIDNVLAETKHKLYHSKESCNCGIPFTTSGHNDEINFKIYNYYKFFKNIGYEIAIFTNRSEKIRQETNKWLQENNIEYDLLEMRSNNDYRPSYAVKEEFLKNYYMQNPTNTIYAVFESDKDCIAMYEINNINNVHDCSNILNVPFLTI